jgi:carboxypeptidase C (cathepsin A)
METYWGYTTDDLENIKKSYEQTCNHLNIDPKKSKIMIKCAESLYLDCKKNYQYPDDPLEWLSKQHVNNEKIVQWDTCYTVQINDKEFKRVMYDENPYVRYGHFMRQYYPLNFEIEFNRILNENNVPFSERLNKYFKTI